jgi:hypothetical protein
MSSTIGVQNIAHTNGTVAATVSSSGNIAMASGKTFSGGGKVLQVKNFQTGASTTGTSQMAADDTIPQNTEGTEVMTLAITPTSTSSNLLIQVVVWGSSSIDAVMTAALFQDSTANALGAITAYQSTGTGTHALQFNHFMTSGTTNSTTFKIRVGINTGTFTFNGYSGGRKLGGVGASSITITEIGG